MFQQIQMYQAFRNKKQEKVHVFVFFCFRGKFEKMEVYIDLGGRKNVQKRTREEGVKNYHFQGTYFLDGLYGKPHLVFL